MVLTSIGALVTSALTIAEERRLETELVPIVVQAIASAASGWCRFYDFPNRMEKLINAQNSVNNVREQMERASKIDDHLWEQYCAAVKLVDSVLPPADRDKYHRKSVKGIKSGVVRQHYLINVINASISIVTGKH